MIIYWPEKTQLLKPVGEKNMSMNFIFIILLPVLIWILFNEDSDRLATKCVSIIFFLNLFSRYNLFGDGFTLASGHREQLGLIKKLEEDKELMILTKYKIKTKHCLFFIIELILTHNKYIISFSSIKLLRHSRSKIVPT